MILDTMTYSIMTVVFAMSIVVIMLASFPQSQQANDNS
jgi:hypothetical protein